MPPKAKKSKKELEEEKSKAINDIIYNNRETRGREENTGGA